VFGAASLVGERTLVRIEKVGRSAAQASLVDPPEGLASASDSSDASDSSGNGRRRRRGRRGGRGRRKKPESASTS
jgi:ribonuclease G